MNKEELSKQDKHESSSVVEFLKKHWFLIVALVTLSSAWGQSQVKIQTLEEAVKQNVTTQSDITVIKSDLARFDERGKALVESQARQERMIELLLNQQQQQLRNQTRAIKQTKNND